MENALLLSFVHNEPEINLEDYKEALIIDVRGKNEGKYKVEGIVAFITYANGFKPNGLFLVDDTASIYVYGSQVAQQVKVGNKIVVAGDRVNYIADNEAALAEKHGYQGAVQLSNPYLIMIKVITNGIKIQSLQPI